MAYATLNSIQLFYSEYMCIYICIWMCTSLTFLSIFLSQTVLATAIMTTHTSFLMIVLAVLRLTAGSFPEEPGPLISTPAEGKPLPCLHHPQLSPHQLQKLKGDIWTGPCGNSTVTSKERSRGMTKNWRTSSYEPEG